MKTSGRAQGRAIQRERAKRLMGWRCQFKRHFRTNASQMEDPRTPTKLWIQNKSTSTRELSYSHTEDHVNDYSCVIYPECSNVNLQLNCSWHAQNSPRKDSSSIKNVKTSITTSCCQPYCTLREVQPSTTWLLEISGNNVWTSQVTGRTTKSCMYQLESWYYSLTPGQIGCVLGGCSRARWGYTGIYPFVSKPSTFESCPSFAHEPRSFQGEIWIWEAQIITRNSLLLPNWEKICYCWWHS